MSSYLNLTDEQWHYVDVEGHHNGKRYVLCLIDRADGQVLMDYKDEILRELKKKGKEIYKGRICDECGKLLTSIKEQPNVFTCLTCEHNDEVSV